MALYKNAKFFTQSESHGFDEVRPAGAETKYSGIYRCEVCGHEEVCLAGTLLPTEAHHLHERTPGEIQWRLIATPAP